MTWNERVGLILTWLLGAAAGALVTAWAGQSKAPAGPPPAAYPTAAEVTVALIRACPKGSIKITLENGKLEGSCLAR